MKIAAIQICAIVLLSALPGCKSKSGQQESRAVATSASPGAKASARGEALSGLAMDEAKEKAGKTGKSTKVKTWKRTTIVPNTSKLMIGDKEHLPLLGMQSHVEVDGFRARVILDCYFYNDQDRQYEGTFKLRLPTGAAPYYLAFGKTTFKTKQPQKPVYVNEKQARRLGTAPEEIRRDRQETWTAPKEARMVPKEKAAHAYTATVRRRVDPALMEWSGAGVFSARVFPLEAKRLHRIVIAYDLDLTPVGDDLVYRFDLPRTKVKTILDLDVAAPPGIKIAVTPARRPHAARGRRYYRFEDPQARTITVRLTRPGPLLLTGADERTGPFFAAAFRPRLPDAGVAGAAQSAVFMVDTSLSSNPDRFNIYLKLLRAILEQNRDQARKFAVLFFNVETRWWRAHFVDNTPENVQALLTHMKGLALEGATDLGAALQEASRPSGLAVPKKTVYDLFLLSDGAATWGEGDRNFVSAMIDRGLARTLFTYTTGMAGTDRPMLAKLARDTGGAVFSVTGEAEVAQAAVAHRSRPWLLEGIEVAGGTDLMLAGRPQAIYPKQLLQLVGRGNPKRGAEVRLKLRSGNKARVVKIRLRRALASPLTPRTYGRVAVEQLEELGYPTEAISTAYACHFRVPGQTSSLLMLESEADYKRYNIKPEEHAFVVKSKPASELISKVLAALGDALSDPKAAFTAWLAKLTKMPGMKLTIPTALKLVLEKMPAASFAIKVPALQVKDPSWQGVSPRVQKQLSTRKLDYGDLTADAERRRRSHGAADALRGLSSLVENSPGDTVLARDVAYSAMAMGLKPQAYHLFRRVAAKRPWEPQTYRGLANVLAAMGKADLALAYYEIALAGQWNSRFGEFRKILGLDYLRFLRQVEGSKRISAPAYVASRRRTLTSEYDYAGVDLLVMITWNTDNSDVDLHVIEPTGEECYYQNRKTKIGGNLTTDVTQGFGPEMYVLTKARSGAYKIRVKYFASVRNRAGARTKVYATVYRNWGTKQELRSTKVVTLAEGKQMHDIIKVVVK